MDSGQWNRQEHERSEKMGRLSSNHVFFGLRLRVKQEFQVAFGAGDGGWDDFFDFPVEIGDGFGDFLDGEFVDFGVADDAAFSDVAPAGFELGLDEDDGLCEGGSGGKDRGEKQCCRDEGDVHDEQGECGLTGFCQCAGSEEAGIGALDEADARIIAELHGDLAKAGVDGSDVRGAALEEAVSKAAGGSADVEAGSAGDVDFPVIEGGLKFESAAADVGHVVAEETDGGIGCNGGAGLVDLLLVGEYAASEDEGAGALATLDESALDEEEIDAGFAVRGQASVRFRDHDALLESCLGRASS